MADTNRPGAKPKETPFPRDWSRLSKQVKEQWLAKNRPGHPNAAKNPLTQPAAPTGASPDVVEHQPAPRPEQMRAGQLPIDQEQAGQSVAEQIAEGMGEMDLRCFVAEILRAVATAVEGAAPTEEQEF